MNPGALHSLAFFKGFLNGLSFTEDLAPEVLYLGLQRCSWSGDLQDAAAEVGRSRHSHLNGSGLSSSMKRPHATSAGLSFLVFSLVPPPPHDSDPASPTATPANLPWQGFIDS